MGAPIGYGSLEEVTLVLQSTDRDGTASQKEFHDFKLFDDQESSVEFQVPESLSVLTVTLRAKIQVLSTGAKQNLADFGHVHAQRT